MLEETPALGWMVTDCRMERKSRRLSVSCNRVAGLGHLHLEAIPIADVSSQAVSTSICSAIGIKFQNIPHPHPAVVQLKSFLPGLWQAEGGVSLVFL